MAVKPNAGDCRIKEQIIEDPTTGLTLQFKLDPSDVDAPVRLVVSGDLPYGNREYFFSPTGEIVGTGTAIGGACPKPSWLTEVK